MALSPITPTSPLRTDKNPHGTRTGAGHDVDRLTGLDAQKTVVIMVLRVRRMVPGGDPPGVFFLSFGGKGDFREERRLEVVAAKMSAGFEIECLGRTTCFSIRKGPGRNPLCTWRFQRVSFVELLAKSPSNEQRTNERKPLRAQSSWIFIEVHMKAVEGVPTPLSSTGHNPPRCSVSVQSVVHNLKSSWKWMATCLVFGHMCGHPSIQWSKGPFPSTSDCFKGCTGRASEFHPILAAVRAATCSKLCRRKFSYFGSPKSSGEPHSLASITHSLILPLW